MESSKVGYWLQVGANIGILAGLVLVALQMEQNQSSAGVWKPTVSLLVGVGYRELRSIHPAAP